MHSIYKTEQEYMYYTEHSRLLCDEQTKDRHSLFKSFTGIHNVQDKFMSFSH